MRNLIITLFIVMSAGGVSAKQNLRDVRAVDDAVFDVAVADEIRKKCPDISARVIKALSLYRSVRAHARSLGFTDDEIDAYADSDQEKARMRAKGEAYMNANGVVASDPQSYCALGRKEIQKSSRIGSLLRIK
ncbi:DUF5333 domain-containing protein [Sulfitobacter sp. F26169L]|uniref:DUF5333 domain-containing protein n=1 Tax=Sulfitobacter sp. F26169L TaxID=2996015 RepID=UPI002260A975|nr:DUF5333 domain-containing protein [Sulfitobacter sp. F26169L]MCX7566248.1 DUF5333 domain-containing protein [Sulfitobacter sp. F26169L]